MIQAKSTGLEDQKGLFLQIIHTNIRQLTDYLRNELRMPSSYDEEILGREVAKVISYMAFNIDPMAVDVSADATVNQFLRDSNSLKNISKYKNYKFYPLISENNNAVAACFGIYLITRIETIKGFSFQDLLNTGLNKGGSYLTGGVLSENDVKAGANTLGDLYSSISDMFGPGDNGKDMPNGGIYFFWKYFKGAPRFGEATPTKEQCSVGYFKGTWKSVIEQGSGLSYDTANAYFLKYYPYIKSAYYTTQDQLFAQARKDEADKAAGRTVKQPVNVGGSTATTVRRSFLNRLFGR